MTSVKPTSAYQICSKCIMDTSDPEISFNKDGVCSWCDHYARRAATDLFNGEAARDRIENIVSIVKAEGMGKPYDCIIGLSGGVDSTMVARTVKELGLRPLAVHLDNGWNSELAVNNIERIVKTYGFDLYTVVLDWEEFGDLHLSFLKAGVANSEVPTDHAIVATLFKLAVDNKIRFIFSGGNLATEGIMPTSWGYDAKDWRHIKSIHKRFGTRRLKKYPHLTLLNWAYYIFVKRLAFIPILNSIDYDKQKAKSLIQSEIGWRDYGGKHFESIYTRFFQAYVLPTKFGFDKRRAHYSSLINAGQMTRDDALLEMKNPGCSAETLREDRIFVLKKLGMSEVEFECLMAEPPHSFSDFPNNHFWLSRLNFLASYAKRIATLNPSASSNAVWNFSSRGTQSQAPAHTSKKN